MMFTCNVLRQLSILALSAVALGQGYPPASSSPSPATTTSPPTTNSTNTHTIKVGFPLGQHAFSPIYLQNVKKGDWIEFQFYPANHSVARMDPIAPCIPYEMNNHSEADSFWTGFYPVSDPTKPESIRMQTKTEEPQWFYCTADESCQKYQMIGVINPRDPKDIEVVKRRAKAANFSLSPGQKFPDESGRVPGATPGNATVTTPQSSKSLSGGAIAGIVIGSIAGIALLGLLFYMIKMRSTSKPATSTAHAPDSEAQDPSMMQMGGGEHPPMYQGDDPRYSILPSGSPALSPKWGDASAKARHQSVISEGGYDQNPHRMSELPSQNYDPVEIYTPEVSDHPDRLHNDAGR